MYIHELNDCFEILLKLVLLLADEYMHTFIYTCIHLCIYMYIRVCLCLSLLVYTSACVFLCECVC